MMQTQMLALSALHLAASVVVLAAHLAVLLVALGAVRPRRPDAASWMALAAGMLLLGDLGSWVSWWLVARMGAEQVALRFAALGLLSALWGAAAWAALLFGVILLCRDPRRQPAPGA